MTSDWPWHESERDDSGVVLAALKLHRRTRAGLVHLLAATVALILGILLPQLGRDPQVSADAAQAFLFALAGGLITFIALVFSLLFLMIQYATTIFTPRLNLFRDDPRLWRTFAVFIGTFVFCATAGLQVGDDTHTTAIVPTLAMGLVLVSLGLAANLEVRAVRLLQMNTTLEELRVRGQDVLMRLYTQPAGAKRPPDPLRGTTRTLRWTDAGTLLVQVNVAKLCAVAVGAEAVVHLHVGVGEEILRGDVLMTVHGATHPIADRALLRHVQVGIDRRFDQDPLQAFRLLNEIAIRALSPAINDPASAVTVTAAVEDLLRIVADKDLDIGRVTDPDGVLRVVLKMPTWDDFLSVGVDDLAPYSADSPMAAARMTSLLDELAGVVPPERRAAVELRQRRFAMSLRGQGSTAADATDSAGDIPNAAEPHVTAPVTSSD
jgi:uncharacterized membrane protein